MIKKVGIVIPVCNKLEYTKKMLQSITDHVSEAEVFVCVINNASTDGTNEFLSQWVNAQNHYLITNTENRGYGPACNQGVLEFLHFFPSEEIDILVCNNDMELLFGCIDELVKAAYSNNSIGIVGARLLFPDGVIQHDGAFLGIYGWGLHKHAGVPDIQILSSNDYPEQEYVTGAMFYVKHDCVIAVKNYYSEIGFSYPLFDEQFAPAYYEEVAVCYLARTLGYITVQNTNAKAIHYENVTGKSIYGNVEILKKKLSDTNQIKFYKLFDGLYEQSTIEEQQRKDKILISCKIYGMWSFTQVMKNLAKGLDTAGVDVAIAPEEYHSPHHMDDWVIKRMIQKPKDYWNRVVLRSCEGDHMYLMPPSGKKRIAHTTGESTRITQGWKDQLNHVDQVITTSTFFRNVLLQNGVITPVTVLPNSVNLKLWQKGVEKMPMQGLRGCNFVSVFHWGERKAPEVLLKAFAEEFKENEDVTLTLHALSMLHVLKQQNIQLQDYVVSVTGTKDRPPIMIVEDYLSEEIMPAFIRNFDVNVLSTRGEGFGLSTIETATAGIPSIVTGYSGVTDFVTPETGWLIDYKLVDIPLQILPYYRNYIGGQWAEPSVEHLRVLLREAYQNKELRLQKGATALEKVKRYDINVIGQQAKDLIFGE